MPFMDQAATAAEKVDNVFLFILALSAAFLIAITSTMVYFVIRYSRKRNPKPRDVHGHTGLEVAWTLIPLVLFLGMFYFGWTNYEYIRNVPRDALEVKVTGRQWAWDFEYPNGKKTDKLYCALDRPVALDIGSADVIHGFYIPAFRIKMDAVPGKRNVTWFQPTQLGSFDIECTVICGADHSYMLSKAVVVEELDFREWYDGGDDAPPPGGPVETASAAPALPAAHPGIAVMREKKCFTCHSTDGSVMVGPTFRGIYGSDVTVRGGGGERRVTVDEDYLTRAIRDPLKEVLKGYPASMPHLPLSDGELKDVIEYIRTLD